MVALRWFGNPSTDYVRSRMAWRYEHRGGDFCCITTPKQGNVLPPDVEVIGDNGRYGDGWPGFGNWVRYVEGLAPEAHRVRFVVAPDVFDPKARHGDAKATLELGRVWLPVIRSLGLKTAFVAQEDSHLPGMIPWDLVDVLFVGGGDSFKWGTEVTGPCEQANRLGIPVHFGRVNGLEHCKAVVDRGGTSADGTLLTFGPDKNLPIVEWWLNTINHQHSLFEPLEHVS